MYRFPKGENLKGSGKITESSDSVSKGLYLLFAPGKRPDRVAIRKFVAAQPGVSISHDPLDSAPIQLAAADGEQIKPERSAAAAHGDLVWVEVLREGLAFDLTGLAPGEQSGFPQVAHRFDMEEVPGPARYEALQLLPGHHLTGGERSVPVVKGLVGLARDLVQHFDDLEAIVWPPSGSVIGRRFYESVTTAWLDGGPFPALGLTAFRETIDGALQSEGLDFWIDQELRIEPPLSADKVAATRMGVRLINQLVLVGGIDGSERIIAPDGSRLVLRTSRNGRFIRVWRE